MAELCKNDQPQWIVVSWTASVTEPIGKQLHESVINNFNFEYLYDFFFDPVKVKGKPYQSLRPPLYKEAVVVMGASDASKKNATDKKIHFFEDFSTTAIGKNPVGWRTVMDAKGATGTVTKLDGLNGNWVTGNFPMTPNKLTKPLPQDFTFSYELVALQNFTWGARGLTVQLSKETTAGNAESFLKLKLKPGYDGRDGEAELETNFPAPPGYLNGSKWLIAKGFSNNKKNNRITVTIKKLEETLQVFIDNNKIAEYEKAIPAAHLFNSVSFNGGGGDGVNDRFYISNIKITKE